MISDVLLTYGREHVPHVKDAANISYNLTRLGKWWHEKRTSQVTPINCRSYAADHSKGMARKDLETLRAALRYYAKFYGPLAVPTVILPDRGPPRERWLSRGEAARLLWAARKHDEKHSSVRRHLCRFVLLGLYTGSRKTVLLTLRWDQIDLRSGVMSRRPEGVTEDARKRTPRVRLGRKILAHLRRWKRLDGPFARYVCDHDGQVLKTLAASFPNAVDRAGLDGQVTPHTLRHTRATWLAQAGVPIWEAAGSLGMSVATFEKVYGHHHPDYQRRAAEV